MSTRTDFLRAHGRLVPQTILVDLDLSRKTLAVKRRTNEYLRQFGGTTALDLDKLILLDDVCKFLLLLLAFVDLLLQLRDLLGDGVEAVAIERSVCD